MMTFEALDALDAFEEQHDHPIPNRGLPPERISRLEELLKNWADDPSQANTDLLLEEFPDPGEDVDQ